MSGRNWASGGKVYSMHQSPVLIDCNFVVDSTNANGLGIRSLKGPAVAHVFMHTTQTPQQGNPNPTGGAAAPAGSPNLGAAAPFAILAASAITGSTGAGSVVTGDMGISPNNGSSVTNFPPSTVIGTTHFADSIAAQAQTDAMAAYVDLTTRSATAISSTLDGQTLTPGVYKEASGTFNLAQSGNGTLTLNGAGVYVFQCSSTLGTGAGGIPTILLTGGASAANVYWVCGSSATINIGVTSAGATFSGTIIALASVTATQAGTVNGRLIALTAAVTLSDTNAVTLAGQIPGQGGGLIVVQLQDNYNRSLSGFSAFVSPASGTALKVDNSALTAGVAYIITTLGTTTTAAWHALGVPIGVTPAVGVSFIAASVGAGGNTSTSRVMTAATTGTGIMTIETVGDPNLSIAPDPTKNQGFGAQFILQARDYTGAAFAPADGSVISLAFYLNQSGNTIQGG